MFDKINNLFLEKLKEYYDDQDILKKSKTSISVNDIEETYSVEDVFEVYQKRARTCMPNPYKNS